MSSNSRFLLPIPILFHPITPSVLLSGVLEVRRERQQGHKAVVARLGAPAMVGDLEMIYRCSRVVSVECVSDCVVCLIRPNTLRELVSIAARARPVPRRQSAADKALGSAPQGQAASEGRRSRRRARPRTFTLPVSLFSHTSRGSEPEVIQSEAPRGRTAPGADTTAAAEKETNGRQHRRVFRIFRRGGGKQEGPSLRDDTGSPNPDLPAAAGASGSNGRHRGSGGGSNKKGAAGVAPGNTAHAARVAAVSSDAMANFSQGFVINTPPDLVIKALPVTNTHVITAGTAEQLIATLLEKGYDEEDCTFENDFFFSYRRFTTPAALLDRFEAAAQTGDGGAGRVLSLLEVWAQAPPFSTDLELVYDLELQSRIASLARSLLGDGPEISHSPIFTQLQAIRRAADARPQQVAALSQLPGTYPDDIAVYVVRPGRVLGHVSMMRFDVTPDLQLRDVLARVSAASTEQSTRYILRNAGGDSSGGSGAMTARDLVRGSSSRTGRPSISVTEGSGDSGSVGTSSDRNAYIDPSSRFFRSRLFGIVLAPETRVREAYLSEVELLPLKASSDSASSAPRLELQTLAQTLTAVEHEIFQQLNPAELLDKKWRAENDEAPFAKAITAHFNAVSDWALELILGPAHASARASVLTQLIRLTDQFEKLKNFSGMVQIISSLRHVAVRRLHQTWALVDVALRDHLDVLEHLVRPDNNRAEYRRKLKDVPTIPVPDSPSSTQPAYRQSEVVCLPYLGVTISDIIFCEDGNKDMVLSYRAKGRSAALPGRESEEKMELFNLYKYRMLARVLEGLRVLQRRECGPADVPEATSDRIAHARWVLARQEIRKSAEIWARSCYLEAPSTAGGSRPRPVGNSAPPHLSTSSSSSINPWMTSGPSTPVRTAVLIGGRKHGGTSGSSVGVAVGAASPRGVSAAAGLGVSPELAAVNAGSGSMSEAGGAFAAGVRTQPKKTRGRGLPAGDQSSLHMMVPTASSNNNNEATMRYLGTFSCPNEREQIRKIAHRMQNKVKPVATVSVIVSGKGGGGGESDGHLIFNEVASHDVVLAVPFERTVFCEMMYSDRICYLAETVVGNKEQLLCHIFLAQGNQPEDAYIAMRRACDEYSKLVAQVSNNVRETVQKAFNEEHAPDGAFCLRDSTSRPGCFALSILFGEEVVHYLIEPVEGGGYALHESDAVFDSLHDLIKYHCITQSTLVCPLRPDFGTIQTSECEPIAINELEGAAVLTTQESPAGDDKRLSQGASAVLPVGVTRTPAVQRSTPDTADDSSAAAVPSALSWYWQDASRAEAEDALIAAGLCIGDFLVRMSKTSIGSHVLTFVADDEEIVHVLVETDFVSGVVMLDGKPCGCSLADMVAQCAAPGQDLLPVPLTRPCPQLGSATIGAGDERAGAQTSALAASPSPVRASASRRVSTTSYLPTPFTSGETPSQDLAQAFGVQAALRSGERNFARPLPELGGAEAVNGRGQGSGGEGHGVMTPTCNVGQMHSSLV